MEYYRFITAFNGRAYFQSDTGKKLEKKVYETPKKLTSYGTHVYGKFYIIHKNEKIYFNSNFIRVLTK